jgi:hypothetical protein
MLIYNLAMWISMKTSQDLWAQHRAQMLVREGGQFPENK